FGDENLFKDFPISIYMLRKHLKIGNFITYSVCPKCDKLYTEKEVADSQDNNRQLSPILLYPFASIKSQLAKMYMHSNFKQLCRKWTHRNVPKGILSAIYDGQ
ncbi:26472_t:CDS:2, partial [Dentiscutata erythropus]